MMDAVFGLFMAFEQNMILFMGLVFFGLGALIAGYGIYMRMAGRGVEAVLTGVRMRVEETEGQPNTQTETTVTRKSSLFRPSPFAGEIYYPVFEYSDPAGQRVTAESDSGSNSLHDKIIGSRHFIHVHPDDPLLASMPTLWGVTFGLIFGLPGAFLIYLAFAGFELNVFSVIVALTGAWWLIVKIRPHLKSKTERGTLAEFRAEMRRKRREKQGTGRLLGPADIAARRAAQERQMRTWRPVMLIIALAMMMGGTLWMQNHREFTAIALSATGRVTGFDSSTDSEGTTYRARVAYLRDGQEAFFVDSVGSSHPMLQTGDTVDVLYDPARPDRAIIDRGAWNMAGPLGLGGGGALILLMLARGALRRRRAS